MENIWHGGVKNICVRWSKNILGTVGGKNSMHGRWKKIFGTADGKNIWNGWWEENPSK